MRFLIDMNLSPRIAESLGALGHDAVHLREEGLQRLPDLEVFAKAAIEERVVITGDLGFGDLVASSAGKTVSVIQFRLSNMDASHVIGRLEAVLPRVEGAFENGAIVTVEDARERVRALPIGG